MKNDKRYINIDGEKFRVKNVKDKTKFKLGLAYIIDDLVLPYYGNINNKKNIIKVGIYKDKKTNSYVLVKPIIKEMYSKYSIKNIYSVDIEFIKNVIKNNDFMDSEDEIIMSEDGDIFSPNITDSDNKLQIAIKKVLANKKIDLKTYSSRFKSATDLNNCKRALLLHGSMSMDRFDKWCDILDVDYELILKNKSKNIAYPLSDEIKIKKKGE